MRIPMPNLPFIVGSLLVLFAVNGVVVAIKATGAAGHPPVLYLVGHMFAGTVKGALAGAVVWGVSRGLSQYRAKAAKPWVLHIGTAIYWIGFSFGIYCTGMAFYILYLGMLETPLNVIPFQLGTDLLGGGLIFWFLARGVRYMLGR